MSTSTTERWVYLAPKAGSSYRQLFVQGRIAARTLYGLYVSGDDPGMSPAEIAADFDVPVEAVREAIVYCESDPPELRADWEADEALAEAAGMKEPNYKHHPHPRRLPPEEWERLCRR